MSEKYKYFIVEVYTNNEDLFFPDEVSSFTDQQYYTDKIWKFFLKFDKIILDVTIKPLKNRDMNNSKADGIIICGGQQESTNILKKIR